MFGMSTSHAAALVAATLGGGVAMAYAVTNQPPARDAIGCLVDQPVAASTVIMVDATDVLTENHRNRVTRDAENALRSTGDGTKLIVLAVQPEEAPAERFARCNPGSTGNVLTQNVEALAKDWKATFGDPLREAVRDLAGASKSARSPLMEAITTATQRPDFDRTVPRRTLIIASDMIQNTPGVYSQYKGDFTKAYTRSALATGDLADLAGVDVIVDYFSRSKNRTIQGPKHRAFWEAWFRDRGAASVRFLGVAEDDGGA